MTSTFDLRTSLSLIPGDDIDGYKRLLIFSALNIVSKHNTISEPKLVSLLKEKVGTNDLMANATLTVLNNTRVLRKWKNPKMRHSASAFYSVASNERLKAICSECVNSHPEFADLEYIKT